ncbi:hypothetical protein HUJ05_012857 [Dendroctonus ponderosae]|nr:hypothetical protein HUJ05_012857 [Dendroctonus ponderosae]
MSTQNYYKEKLGFDPRESIYNDAPPEKYRKTGEAPHGYEENLTKFKGTIWDLFIQATSGTVLQNESLELAKAICNPASSTQLLANRSGACKADCKKC